MNKGIRNDWMMSRVNKKRGNKEIQGGKSDFSLFTLTLNPLLSSRLNRIR